MTYFPKNASQTLIFTLFILFLNAIFIIVSQQLPLGNSDQSYFVYSIFGYISIFYLIKFLKIRFSIYTKFKASKPKFRESIILVCFSMLICILTFPIYMYLEKDIKPNESYLFAISSILIAPVLEELFFRGILLGGLLQNKSVLYSVFLTTLIFVSLHFNFSSLIIISLLSIIASYVYVLSKNIVYPIILHISFNAVNLTLPYLIKDLSISLLCSLVCFIILLILSIYLKFYNYLAKFGINFNLESKNKNLS